MACFDYGGDLVTVESEGEMERMNRELEEGQGYWMGLNSKLPTTVDQGSDSLDACVLLSTNLQQKMTNCDENKKYICRKST